MARVECVECGAQVERSEMFGPPDELRCAACARRRRDKFAGPRRRLVDRRPVATLLIIGAAGVLTLASWSAPALPAAMVDNQIPIWEGEIWRFVTTALLHGGVLHLLFDLYWMWIFGQSIEGRLGRVRYLGLVGLLAAGPIAAEFLLSGPAIGLSGVVYGLFGFLFAQRRERDYAAELMQPQTVWLFLIWLAVCYTGMVGPIANTAHLAGALIGWLIGTATLQRAGTVMIAGVVGLVLALVAGTQYMPWNAHYAYYRFEQCQQHNDQAGADYWARKLMELVPPQAERAAPPVPFRRPLRRVR